MFTFRLATFSLALAVVGCAHVAEFTVTRPAMLNATETGNTMWVAGIAPNGQLEAAADVTADLQNRIAHSLNPSIQLVQGGGGVVISGTIVENTYAENLDTVDRQCTRQVQYGTDSNGVAQYRTEYYPCPEFRRSGVAVSRVELTIISGATGQVIFERVYEHHDSRVTTSQFGTPAYIDGEGMLHALRAAAVAQFARVILPWQETVRVEFETCDHDDRCGTGFERVQHGDLTGADRLFTNVIASYGDASVPIPPASVNRVSEALYNRGLTRAYLGHYPEALADLTRAISMRPDVARWRQELANVQVLAHDAAQLLSQGAPVSEGAITDPNAPPPAVVPQR